MSLVTGNPVASGTVISSTVFNNTMTDFKSEITNSLDRNGRGAMLAPLQNYSGTLGAPGITYSGDTNTGFFRQADGEVLCSSNGNEVCKFSSTTFTVIRGLTATQANTNENGVTSTGNGSGAGVRGTGGVDGPGGSFSGGTNGGSGVNGAGTVNFPGGSFSGNGTASGVQGTGGATGAGGTFSGGATSGAGVVATATTSGNGVTATGAGSGNGVTATGGSSGVGGSFSNATAATGGARKDAVTLTNGDLDLSGVANPSSTTAVSERLTPLNLVKAWGSINVGSGSPTVAAGFNISSVSCAANVVTVNLASAFASGAYAVIPTYNYGTGGSHLQASISDADTFVLTSKTGGATDNLCAVGTTVEFIALGAQ